MPSRPQRTREIAPLPKRPPDAHKGSVGRLLIVGGSDDAATGVTMSGAPALAARAAFRSGAGLVQLVVPEAIKSAVASLVPDATLRTLPPDGAAETLLRAVADFQADAVAIGPGLGRTVPIAELLRFVQTCDVPLVLDADALNTLAQTAPPRLPRPSRVVLTPHPGEAQRLLKGWNPVAADAGGREAAAVALYDACGAVVVLKGRGTLVTNGQRLFINETGNAGLATAGTGDVLTGIIAALIGGGMDAFEAAVVGVHIHGLAGDFAAHDLGQRCMTAIDVIEYLPDAFAEVEED